MNLRHMGSSSSSYSGPELARIRQYYMSVREAGSTPWGLGSSPQQYLQYAHRCVAEHLSPYWRALPWPTLSALIHTAGNWLPSLPGVAYFYVPMLSALNMAGANLPRTLVWIMVEIFRTDREVGAGDT